MSVSKKLAIVPGTILIFQRNYLPKETYLVIGSTTLWDGRPGWIMFYLEECTIFTMDNDYVTTKEVWNEIWEP